MNTLGRITASLLAAMVISLAALGVLDMMAFIRSLTENHKLGFWIGCSAGMLPLMWRLFK